MTQVLYVACYCLSSSLLFGVIFFGSYLSPVSRTAQEDRFLKWCMAITGGIFVVSLTTLIVCYNMARSSTG